MPWDVQHAATVRPMLGAVTGRALRATTEAVLDRYAAAVAPLSYAEPIEMASASGVDGRYGRAALP